MIRRTELRNDNNREPWTNLYTFDPHKSVIAWAWTRHRHYQKLYEGLVADPGWSHLTFHRLRSRRDSQRLLNSLYRGTPELGGPRGR